MFTIPNEADALVAAMASPDSKDVEVLVAGLAGTGVVGTGCQVTAQGVPDLTLAVAAGTVAVAGVTAAVAAGNVTITTAHATNPRFDLVVVNSSGTKSVTAGTAAATPVFPTIPASSVVLAAVYVPANDTAIGSTQIVDKRAPVRLLKSVDDPGLWSADLGFDYEFEGSSSSLPSGWSWVNQGSATYQEDYGAGVLASPSSASSFTWRAIVRSLSGAAASWTATVKLPWIGGRGADSYGALLLRQSSDGKMVTLGTPSSVTGGWYIDKWTTATAYNSSFVSNKTTAHIRVYEYLRIRKNSASSWDFLVSPDGLSWFPIGSAIDVGAYMTPDQIGFGTENHNSETVSASCHWLRLR